MDVTKMLTKGEDEFSIFGEFLDAMVDPIRNIYISFSVCCNP
jgi:hypothetical protein